MLEEVEARAERDITWLATHQPAVIRLLERELASSDGDAFAAGLALAWSLLGDASPWSQRRLTHAELAAGMLAMRPGESNSASEIPGHAASLSRSIRDQIAALPLSLSAAEIDAVVAAIAAITWAALEGSVGGVGETLVA